MPDSQGKYSLEELLRAKRQERPSSEFWVSFDRELKSKQKLLIQKQLVHETRRKAPSAAYIFRFGAFAATCGAAAFAIYFGLDNSSQTEIAQTDADLREAAKPTFTVATREQTQPAKAAAGLQEFATLAQSASPRVVIAPVSVAAVDTTPRQSANAMETMAALEETIRGNRATPSLGAFDLANAKALFEGEYALEEPATNEEIWNFEQAYLLGKYADPLNGTVGNNSSAFQRVSADSSSLSQLEDVLSSQSSRRNRSLDALTVRF